MGCDGGGRGVHGGKVGHGQAPGALEGLEGHVGGDVGGSGDPDDEHGDGAGHGQVPGALEGLEGHVGGDGGGRNFGRTYSILRPLLYKCTEAVSP